MSEQLPLPLDLKPLPCTSLHEDLAFCVDCRDYTEFGSEADAGRATKRGVKYWSEKGNIVSGTQEPEVFSRSPCDCCDSDLAGERHYYNVIA